MNMGARSRRMSSGFPGYSAPPALTRSTRSSRGRAGLSRKVAAGLSFDWLAEVAAVELEHKTVTKEMMDVNPAAGSAAGNKSDNESGTSLSLECMTNAAAYEEEKAAAAAAAAMAMARNAGLTEVRGKTAVDVLSAVEAAAAAVVAAAAAEQQDSKAAAAAAVVKDEECSSECIMVSEDGADKKTSRRSRKRKASKTTSWTNTKRSKNVEVEASPAKAASVATSSGTRKGDGLVKVSVKSFTIPELYVDIPESSTVGTLKRAVMDAAMNLLGGGLRVCVLLQGRKVPDEAATLSQMGILHGGKADLGFMLEPTSVPSSSSSPDDPLLVLLHAASQPNSRCPAYVMPADTDNNNTTTTTTATTNSQQQLYPQQPAEAVKPSFPVGGEDEQINNSPPHSGADAAAAAAAASKPPTDNDEQTKNESDSTSTLSQGTPCKPRVFDAKAIILHPGAIAGEGGEGMALVPLRPKSHALDIHKRRIRRPFSVGEVESLVHAVEQLGTGRWRDVKLQAFENAKHRTYVDLKDKWKTLVHTAQIAPHQRRGDPVPQELLDRVIAANNFWAAHQAKEQAEMEA